MKFNLYNLSYTFAHDNFYKSLKSRYSNFHTIIFKNCLLGLDKLAFDKEKSLTRDEKKKIITET